MLVDLVMQSIGMVRQLCVYWLVGLETYLVGPIVNIYLVGPVVNTEYIFNWPDCKYLTGLNFI
jgi:hypothetical protein